jgi:chromosome segregation ATPase
VEQQSDLIMMLKQRNDDLQKEITTLKGTLSASGMEKVRLETAKDAVVKELATLQERFATLAKQHQQMIEIKDEHKTARYALKEQVDKLAAEIKTITEKLDEEHKDEKASLRTQLTATQKQLADAQQELQRTASAASKQSNQASTTTADMKAKYDALVKDHDKLKTLLQTGKTKSDKTIKRLQGDEKAASTAAEKAIARADHLGTELHASEGAARAALDEVKQLKAKLKKESANAVVTGARAEIEAAVQAMESVKQEYSAYKKYSSDLLKKEKDMNNRLRHLHASGPPTGV